MSYDPREAEGVTGMDELELASTFDRQRPQLRAVAYRILGSLTEADDAVQEGWLRLSRTDAHQIDSLMESIAAKSGDSDASRVAVLASLHLADRLRAVEKELEDLKRRVEEKSTQCALLLDQALEDG